MAKRTAPKLDILYTFQFRKGNITHYSRLEYMRIKENGRLEFYNHDTNSYTSMRPERFSYIRRYNKVKEEKIVPPPRALPKKTNVTVNVIEEEFDVNTDKILKSLQILNSTQRAKIEKIIGRPFADFFNDFKQYLTSDSTGYSPVLSEYIRIEDCLGRKIAKILN